MPGAHDAPSASVERTGRFAPVETCTRLDVERAGDAHAGGTSRARDDAGRQAAGCSSARTPASPAADELTRAERIELTFMANGVVSIFDLAHKGDFTALYVSMIDSHLVRGIIAEMNAIKACHPHPTPDECAS